MTDNVLEKNSESGEEPKGSRTMHALVADFPTPTPAGELATGTVINISKSSVLVNMKPFGTGIIYGREFINARDIIKHLSVGDEVKATVVDAENEDGYVELSLKEARQALVWSEAETAMKNKTPLEVAVKEANKGGLILEWQGIQAFLPASQLSQEHYPRVEGGDKNLIVGELNRLIGQNLTVQIIGVDQKEGKLIFSERTGEEETKEVLVSKYQVGDEVEGEVTGVVDFGIFIKVEEGLEGLAHISELDWGLVEDPNNLFSVGNKVRAKIIEVKDNKISLSVKALKENPWKEAGEKYKKDDKVNAVIIKYNKHGALASVEEGVAGLVHISEFESPEELRQTLELGKNYPFTINLFEPKEQRMTLSYKKTEEKK